MMITAKVLVRCPSCGGEPDAGKLTAAVKTRATFQCDRCGRVCPMQQATMLIEVLSVPKAD